MAAWTKKGLYGRKGLRSPFIVMFRFGRSTEPAAGIVWSQLLPLLEDDDQRAAVARLFPEVGRESFLRALERLDQERAQRLRGAGRQLEAAQPLSRYPTMAVAGMLNSGKTSVVASFLSRSGRARALRGESNREGTHRFVLWLPERWREQTEVWSLLLRRVGDALGNAPELLSEDPRIAHQQYNNQTQSSEALGVPLVATDEGLDEHGVGLLDCPDIVSDAAFGRGTPEGRRELLRRATPLCSAFLVVTGAEAIRDTTLGDLLRIAAGLMPGVPRYLLVNKVRAKQPPDSVWANTAELVNHHRIDGVYAAYDYEIPAAQPFIPKFRDVVPLPMEEPLPSFFRLSENPDDNPPQVIEANRSLFFLPTSLDHPALFQQVRGALELRLEQAVWIDGVDVLAKHAAQASERANRVRRKLLEGILDFFAHRQPGGRILELRLHQSERIVRQLSQAFADGAPWYARFGMRLHSRVRRFWGGAGDLVRKLAPTHIAEQTAQAIKEKMKLGKQGSMLTADRLVEVLVKRSTGPADFGATTEGELQRSIEAAIARFESEDFTALDPERLKLAVAEVWKRMPAGKKFKAGLTPLAIIFATFGAALMIPIDFGTTQVIYAATIKELMLAAGLSVVVTAWGGGRTALDVEQQAAQQQLSNFLAILLDRCGIPRGDDIREPLEIEVGGKNIRLPEPTIPPKPTANSAWSLWSLRNEFLLELAQYVKRP